MMWWRGCTRLLETHRFDSVCYRWRTRVERRWRVERRTLVQGLLVVAAVGIPGFLQFNKRGFAHDYGLLNAQSVSRITLYFILAYVLVCVLALPNTRKRPQVGVPKSMFGFREGFGLAMLLYATFLFSLFKADGPMDFFLGLYRICEWILVMFLCWFAFRGVELKSRRGCSASDTLFSLLKYITTIPVVVTLVGVLLVPELAMFDTGGIPRLGGYLYYPNRLGLIAGIGAFVFLFHSVGLSGRIWAGVLVAVMVFTYSRGALLGFLLGIVVFYGASLKERRVILASALGPAVTILILAFAYVYYEEVVSFLARGGSIDELGTLNSRTSVWGASWEATLKAPLFGHGFIFGPKQLGAYLDQPWWFARHAHNDILNAGVGGGIAAAALAAAIYIRLGYELFTCKESIPYRATIVAVYVQILAYAMLTPVLSGGVGFHGVILLLLVRYMLLVRFERLRHKGSCWKLRVAHPYNS